VNKLLPLLKNFDSSEKNKTEFGFLGSIEDSIYNFFTMMKEI